MQLATPNSNSGSRGIRSIIGVAIAALGAVAMAAGIAVGPVAGGNGTQTVPLHNATADVEKACPDGVNDYWHFILAPNNGTFSFQSITLNLSGTSTTFSGGKIIPNGGQADNVFVAVPPGSTLASIVLTGSSAEVSPVSDDPPKFNLSHLCAGSGTTTSSTSTSTSTSTTSASTSTTTTSISTSTTSTSTTSTSTTSTSTTVDDTSTTSTSTTVDDTSTTTEQPTTTEVTITTAATTTSVASQPPPTPPTSTVDQAPPSPTTTPLTPQLPRTGGGNRPLVVVGAILMLLGCLMMLGTRRPLPLD